MSKNEYVLAQRARTATPRQLASKLAIALGLQLRPLRGLFLLAARQSSNKFDSALAPQRRFFDKFEQWYLRVCFKSVTFDFVLSRMRLG
jgi:hypothetical protein